MAEWVVIISDTDVKTGLDPDYDDDSDMDFNLLNKNYAGDKGAKVELANGETAKRDLTFKVDVYMVNGGALVRIDTVEVKIPEGATAGFTAINGLASGQQYRLVCGSESVLLNG